MPPSLLRVNRKIVELEGELVLIAGWYTEPSTDVNLTERSQGPLLLLSSLPLLQFVAKASCRLCLKESDQWDLCLSIFLSSSSLRSCPIGS